MHRLNHPMFVTVAKIKKKLVEDIITLNGVPKEVWITYQFLYNA